MLQTDPRDRACVVSVVRLVCASKDVHSLDLLWAAGSTALLRYAIITHFMTRAGTYFQESAVEINLGIICGCMTAIPVFFRQCHTYFRGLVPSTSLKSQIKDGFKGSRSSKSTSAASKKIARLKLFHGLSLHLEHGSHMDDEELFNLSPVENPPYRKGRLHGRADIQLWTHSTTG